MQKKGETSALFMTHLFARKLMNSPISNFNFDIITSFYGEPIFTIV